MHIFRFGRTASNKDNWRRYLGAAALATLASTSANAKVDLLPGYFLGQAVSVQGQAQAGPVGLDFSNAAVASCPCRGTNGHRQVSTVSALSIGPAGSVLNTAVNKSTSYGLKTATTADTKQTSNIEKVNLLAGLITADSLHAVADVSATSTSITPEATGSGFVNLVVAGQRMTGHIKPNTTLDLPGLGSVTLKFVNAVTYGNDAAGVEVEMLRVQISQANSLGLPVGTTLVLGEAYAGYARAQPAATIGGYAETLAVTANAGTLLQEAASAGSAAGIPSCIGTVGKTITNSVANIEATGLLSLDAVSTSAFGGPVGNAIVAKTTSSVGKVSLLGGLITADSIVAAAQVSRTKGVSTASSSGSTFGNLTVAGVAVAANVPANTTISLPGVGFVALNEQPSVVANHIQVNGLHIVATLANNLGLPVGAEIFIAHADATASAF